MLVLGGCGTGTSDTEDAANNTNSITNTINIGETMTKIADVRVILTRPYSIGNVILFEIFNENILRVTSFNQNFYISPESRTIPTFAYDFYSKAPTTRRMFQGMHRIVEEVKIELTQEQSDAFGELINNITEKGPDRDFEWPLAAGYLRYVLAIIDGHMYWSLHHRTADFSGSEFINSLRDHFNLDLLLLMHEIGDLSPIPILSSRQ